LLHLLRFRAFEVEVKKMNKTKFYDERLSFPTKLTRVPGGIVEVYIIPDEKKRKC
jgi:hypothetical protein